MSSKDYGNVPVMYTVKTIFVFIVFCIAPSQMGIYVFLKMYFKSRALFTACTFQGS